jgi:hypothetical protein
MREFNRRKYYGGRLIKVKDVKKIGNVNKLKDILSKINISTKPQAQPPRKPFSLH